jgi:uncharacterized membrane protein required for colicin V production
MNQVDLFILVVVAVCALSGARRGLIDSVGDLVAIILALAVGSLAYPLVDVPLRWALGLPPAASGPLGFIVVAVATLALVGLGWSRLAARIALSRRTSRTGGAALGAVTGLLLAAVLVLASGLIPGTAGSVAQSALAPRITVVVPRLYQTMESLGLPLPRLVLLPADYRQELQASRTGLRFMRLNFTRLDGSMCIYCRSEVEFVGYRFSRGTLISPFFRCPHCGRTSDGCQTFEGFHAIYGECPVTLAEEGLQFDCGVWTNGWWTSPHGPCPVCGREYTGDALPAIQRRPPAALPRP